VFWTRRKRTPAAISAWAAVLLVLLFVGAETALLWMLGRPLACSSCTLALWPANAAGHRMSQYFADGYSASHFIYGVLIYWVLFRTCRHWPVGWLFVVAALSSITWELVENTPWVIERFGAAKAGPVYRGDSILNSVGDTVFVLAGFALSRILPITATAALVAALEIAAALAIRDSLLLSTLMFILPLDAVAHWQAGG
jgi:hypothetical protein